MPTQDASAYIRMKRLNVKSTGSVNINSIKIRAPSVYGGYSPAYRTIVAREGLASNKGVDPLEEFYDRYIELINSSEIFQNIPIPRLLSSSSDDEPYPVPIAAYARTRFTDLLVNLSKQLMTVSVNSTKLTEGSSLRNIKLSKEAYNSPNERNTTVQDATYVPDLSNSQNYAIYKNEDTNTLFIAFKGTSTLNELLIVDTGVAAGYTSNQLFVDAVNLYNSLINNSDFENWSIETTGHSLGGTIALYLNVLFGIKAEAFNPGIGMNMFYDNINKQNATAHIVKGDIVSPLILRNKVVNTLNVYQVENSNYGFFGYHIPRNFY